MLWLTPKSLGGIFRNLRQVGKATGRLAEAKSRIAHWRKRLEAISTATRDCAQTRVFCMEWIDPLYCSGHWVPEMVRYAGGVDVLGREGRGGFRPDRLGGSLALGARSPRDHALWSGSGEICGGSGRPFAKIRRMDWVAGGSLGPRLRRGRQCIFCQAGAAGCRRRGTSRTPHSSGSHVLARPPGTRKVACPA